MGRLSELHLRACRARISEVERRSASDANIGDVVLRSHQLEAVRQVNTIIDEHHGCLLADDVGRGKTFVALAVARRWHAPVVIVPAALRETWGQAMRRVGVCYPLISHESLSRGGVSMAEPDGVIVDESHHFRNAGTRRHAVLADLAMRADVLLLSATPVQNRTDDLANQLALFLGSHASRSTADGLSQYVVRVDAGHDDWLPVLRPARWVPVAADDARMLRAIVDLPDPPRALDAGDAGALRMLALVRLWASSRAALAASLARRLRLAAGIEQGLDAGRLPSRAEVAAWNGSDDGTVQLGFASLLVASTVAPGEADAVRAQLAREEPAVRGLLALIRATPDPDAERARTLAALADAHPGARVLAFTGLARTARAYFSHLAHRPGVALLTAREARIASGRIPRQELLQRFAPRAQGVPDPPPRERVDLLIATDLLSEGVNLQDASIVVHLDLPWNPARLAQRVGRARRPSGMADVSSYLLSPPAPAEVVLAMEQRLRRKVEAAEEVIGRGPGILPVVTLAGLPVTAGDPTGALAQRGALEARLATWRRPPGAPAARSPMLSGGAVSADTGWLAVLQHGAMVGALNGHVGSDPALLNGASAAAGGPPRALPGDALRIALATLRRHLDRYHALAACGAGDEGAPLVQALERRVATLLTRAPRHDRMALLEPAARLRAALWHPVSAGAEHALSLLLAERERGDARTWLERAADVVARPRRATVARRPVNPLAIIVFGPR